MSYSQSQNKATQRYQAKAYDNISLRVKAGQGEIVKEYAKSQGLSLNSYLNKLISDDIGDKFTNVNKKSTK